MKYIIFDLDDTLLNKQKKISDYTWNVLKSLQAKGHVLVINTARSLAYSQQYVDHLQPDFAITNAGALISDSKGNKIYSQTIPMTIVNLLLQQLHPVVQNISVDNEKGFFTSDPHYHNQNAIYFDFTQPFPMEAAKIVLQTKNPEKVKEFVANYHLEHSQYVNGDWHRISPQGCSKWNGVLALLEHTKGRIEDTITFGDDIGDLEMLEKANIGVAMANSIPQVLASIKNVTLSNEEDGVARYLEKLLVD